MITGEATMKYVLATLIAIPLSFATAAPSYAGHSHREEYCDHKKQVYKIEKRLDRQFHRIERGIDRERLTHKEAKQLKKRYRKIHRLSREYRDDGYLSHSEYKHLTRKLNKNSRLIKEYMNNGIDRYIAYHDEYSPYRPHYRYNWD
jgi:Ni/Co efflux regulator RcnB